MSIEAMKQALAALEATMSTHGSREHIEEVRENAITSLRQAIADLEKHLTDTTQPAQPKREWVGLTEQEAAECWSTSSFRTWQAIEAKLKEKNA
jgi:hypothetical protein